MNTLSINYQSAAEAVKLIKSGMSVYIQGTASVPNVVVKALADHGPNLRGVKIYCTLPLGDQPAPYCREELLDSFEVYSFFLSDCVRDWVSKGYAQMVPVFFGDLPELIRKDLVHIDAAMINCSLPDERGYCSYGIAAEATVAAVEKSSVVIAQINDKIPYVQGDAMIHLSKISACVEVSEDPYIPASKPISESARKIAQIIAPIIPDGATLQIGVGGIPDAVLSELKDHKHLGLHTELLTDGTVDLLEKGIIDNSCKTILRGKSVCTLALGSRRLYDYMDHNPDISSREVSWTNKPEIIGANPKVMAVNSAIEVDITGQVCADSIGVKIFSSAGGQHDFMQGCTMSEGGRSFIAIPSMTNSGVSKIKSVLTPGAGVVTSRYHTQYVVTEYGAALLLGKGLAERARALINIAHPSVRESLEREAVARFGRSFLRLK